MRPIKFRAWDKKLKKWRGEELFAFMLFTGQLSGPRDGTDLADIEVVQFTGLKDRNGKEIFEGDIIKNSGGQKAFVSFEECNNGGFGWCATFEGKHSHPFLIEYPKNCDVIGNIHENGDLLK